MATLVSTFVLLMALVSPQLWSRTGSPSQLQPIFLMIFIMTNVYWHGVRLPRTAAAQLILAGWTSLLLGGLASIFFLFSPELFLQELLRRVTLVMFLWSAFSAAAYSGKLLFSASVLAAVMVAVYGISLLLYYAGWSPLRDSGYFDAYPFGLLIPVAVYSNPLIFPETQLLAYFLIAIGMLSAKAGHRWSKLHILSGLIQFGKGPLLGYVVSLFPRIARVIAIMMTLCLLIALWLSMGGGGPPEAFDGDYGSLAERKYHIDTVIDSMVGHPTHGLLGYGLRQYGSYLATHSSAFGPDTVPLSVVQWIFEAGIPIAVLGLMLVMAGSIGLPAGKLLSIGVYAFVAHLALPNPADSAVLLVFALLAGETERLHRGAA